MWGVAILERPPSHTFDIGNRAVILSLSHFLSLSVSLKFKLISTTAFSSRPSLRRGSLVYSIILSPHKDLA